MRTEFSNSLIRFAEQNENFVVLTGDHGYALFDSFRDQFPNKFINCGVAEQNMVGVAAGLARRGFIPLVYGLSSFVPIRVLEQIKLDVAHDQLRVIFIGDGAGFVYSQLGTSHQSTEDIASTVAIPNLEVHSPADAFELRACMERAISTQGPTYIRIGKGDLGAVHEHPINETFGIISVKERQNSRIVIIATGSMVKSLQLFSESAIGSFDLYSAPLIKPFDEEGLLRATASAELVVTVEEHSVYGGLGAQVAQLLSKSHPKKVLTLGVKNRFTESCGSYEYLLTEHGLDIESIVAAIESVSKH